MRWRCGLVISVWALVADFCLANPRMDCEILTPMLAISTQAIEGYYRASDRLTELAKEPRTVADLLWSYVSAKRRVSHEERTLRVEKATAASELTADLADFFNFIPKQHVSRRAVLSLLIDETNCDIDDAKAAGDGMIRTNRHTEERLWRIDHRLREIQAQCRAQN